jgi:hypothetical protein
MGTDSYSHRPAVEPRGATGSISMVKQAMGICKPFFSNESYDMYPAGMPPTQTLLPPPSPLSHHSVEVEL